MPQTRIQSVRDGYVPVYDGQSGDHIRESSVTIDAGDLTATSINTALIHNAAAIAIKPSGDNDDYFELSTSAGTPIITIKGDDYLRLKAGNGLGAVHGFLVGPDDGDNIQIGWDIASGYPFVYSLDGIAIQPSGDISDYILVKTVSNVPEITTIGECNLKISAESPGQVVLNDKPYITDYTNAQHDHSSAAEGGAIPVLSVLDRWTPQAMYPPSSGYPDFTFIGSHPAWAFEVNEYLYMDGIMPPEYLEDGFTVYILFSHAAASQSITLAAYFELVGDDELDMDAGDDFAAAQTVAKTSSATIGNPVVASIAFTDAQIDGIDPGDFYRLKIAKTVDSSGSYAYIRGVWIIQ